eukprot:3490584-Lingulodinium_polyedra.AAC.1
MGLPVLRFESERPKVVVGNKTMAATVSVALCCLSQMAPFPIENPAGSMIWEAPGMQSLRARHAVWEVVADFCHG